MGFLNRISFALLLFLITTTARGAFTGAQITTSASRGSGYSSSLGGGGKLRFNRSDFHFDYSKQYSKLDSTDRLSATQTTTNSSGGFNEGVSENFSIGLDYDKLYDPTETLTIDGGKITIGYGDAEVSYREAKSVIDQSAVIAGRTYQGAFIYQSTIETSYDLELGESDSVSPSFSYSFFSPDLDHFANVLTATQTKGRNLTAINNNFQQILQRYELWSARILYAHDFDEDWNGSMSAKISKTPILDSTMIVDLNPTLGRKWSPLFSTLLGYDYSSVSGEKNWTVSLDLKFTFKAKKDREAN